jgi:hypothetical protein
METFCTFEFQGPMPCECFSCTFIYIRSRDSSVGIATGYGPGRVKNFLFSKSSRPAVGSTQSPNQLVPGALSSGVKRPGREVDHSPQTRAEVKRMWICTFHSPIRLHGVVLN